jgi:hypothetical protein
MADDFRTVHQGLEVLQAGLVDAHVASEGGDETTTIPRRKPERDGGDSDALAMSCRGSRRRIVLQTIMLKRCCR